MGALSSLAHRKRPPGPGLDRAEPVVEVAAPPTTRAGVRSVALLVLVVLGLAVWLARRAAERAVRPTPGGGGGPPDDERLAYDAPEVPLPEPSDGGAAEPAEPAGERTASGEGAPAGLVGRSEALEILGVAPSRLDVMVLDGLVTVVTTDVGERVHRAELEGVRLLGG